MPPRKRAGKGGKEAADAGAGADVARGRADSGSPLPPPPEGDAVDSGGERRWKFQGSSRSLVRRLCQICFMFVMVHYLFWGVPFAVGGVLLWFEGPLYQLLIIAAGLAYMPSFLNTDSTQTGRPWDWVRLNPLWRLAHEYLDLEVVRTQALDPTRRYVFGFHPHGILLLSRTATYGGLFEQAFPGLRTRCLAASPMFLLPMAREICLWCGAVDAARTTASRCLRAGLSLIVYPGGSKEIFKTDGGSGDTELVLSERLGFVKLAMRNGAQLVPTLVFGEKWMYSKLHLPAAVTRFFLAVLRTPLLLFWGRWFTWLPRRENGLSVVYGAPLETPHIEEPTDAEVQEVHGRYVAALKALYAAHKGSMRGYDVPEEKLVIT